MAIMVLPVEIIILIGESCSSLRHVNAFSQASCRLYSILNKHLYRRDFRACDRGFVIAAGKDNVLALRKIIREAEGRRLSFSDAVRTAVRSESTTALTVLVEAIPKSDFLEEFLKELPRILSSYTYILNRKGAVEQLLLLLSIVQSVALSQRPQLSSNLLDWAIGTGRYRLNKLLLENGAQPSDSHYKYLFRHYGYGLNPDWVNSMTKLFLDMCPDSARSPTTFALAVEAKCVSAVEILISGGADLEALDANGHPPLWHAIGWRGSDMLKCLLDRGASPNAVSADGTTLVDRAIETDCYESLDILVDYGAHVLRANLQNCKKLLCETIPRKDFRFLQQIIRQRVKILCDKDVIEALRRIFPNKSCDDKTFRAIICHLRWFGAHHQSSVASSVNLFDRSLVSLIPKDGTRGTGLIGLLLEYGANPNVHLPRHGSALEAVARGKSHACTRLLIEHGLDLDKLDHAYLERILWLAITSGNSMLVRKLLEKGIDPDFNQRLARCDLGAPIWEAISRRHSSTVQILISGGANIHVKKDGWTLLGYAANNRLLGVVQSLLAAGADPLEKSGPEEKAALEWLLCPFDQIKEGTIQKTREKIAKLLTDRYTDEQLKSEGPQILSLATKMGYRRLQQRLMKMGVSPPDSCVLLD